jgi:adenylate cyclase
LYNSGIVSEVIAFQMDMNEKDVLRVLEEVTKREKETEKKVPSLSSFGSFRKDSSVPLISKLYLDKAVNLDYAIKYAQTRMWRALKVKSDFDISMEETQNNLKNYAESKTTFLILHVDLVDSTRLSMTLPVNRLATIVRAFSQEISLIISAYGGYVLKYIGDAILAYFPLESSDDFHIHCINAVSCACSMIKVVDQGINPILNQYDYPELRVRIGIDIGENAVVQFGWDTHTLDGRIVLRDPHFDILGYTISITAKMTAFANPDQIVIGQLVYQILDDKQKAMFRLLPISPQIWNYLSDNTGGGIYRLYGSIKKRNDDSRDDHIDLGLGSDK